MKNFGGLKWNFSNLGEVTWGARDPPFPSSSPGDFFFLPLFRDFFSSFLASFLLLPARPPEHHRSSISCYFLCSSSPLPLLPLQPRAAAAENKSFRWSAGQVELAGTPTLRWFQAVQSGGKGLNSLVEPLIFLILAWFIEFQFWCSWAKMIKLA